MYVELTNSSVKSTPLIVKEADLGDVGAALEGIGRSFPRLEINLTYSCKDQANAIAAFARVSLL